MYKDEIFDALENDALYDYICNNYYKIDDYTLLELLKECIATIQDNNKNKELIDNLIEFEDWEK